MGFRGQTLKHYVLEFSYSNGPIKRCVQWLMNCLRHARKIGEAGWNAITQKNEVWLLLYKKQSGKNSISY
jgi:hypothetical protein